MPNPSKMAAIQSSMSDHHRRLPGPVKTFVSPGAVRQDHTVCATAVPGPLGVSKRRDSQSQGTGPAGELRSSRCPFRVYRWKLSPPRRRPKPMRWLLKVRIDKVIALESGSGRDRESGNSQVSGRRPTNTRRQCTDSGRRTGLTIGTLGNGGCACR